MITHAAVAFITVFLAELPDKTMVASIVLTTRYKRPLAVWVGVSIAFAIHVAAAVLLGTILSKLPHRPVEGAVGVLFLIGAYILWREHGVPEEHEPDRVATSFTQIALASGLVVLIAELGDLTQLATAGLASRSGDPLGTAIGAWLALATVAALAVTAGRWIEKKVPLDVIRRVAAIVFLVFGLWSLFTAIRG
jgi:Ca2+/H+ antiporter, TMEM165/GDT1 family